MRSSIVQVCFIPEVVAVITTCGCNLYGIFGKNRFQIWNFTLLLWYYMIHLMQLCLYDVFKRNLQKNISGTCNRSILYSLPRMNLLLIFPAIDNLYRKILLLNTRISKSFLKLSSILISTLSLQENCFIDLKSYKFHFHRRFKSSHSIQMDCERFSLSVEYLSVQPFWVKIRVRRIQIE